MAGEPHGGVKQVAEEIDAVGAENYILSTDLGVYTLPAPVEGFREFIACMLDLGIPTDDLRTMTARNPAGLLGIETVSD
jgi:predicted amidohydrolase